MNSNDTPCRVSADLRIYEAKQRDAPEPDASDLLQAREELAEKIVMGKTVGGIDILACLDIECDNDTPNFLADLDKLFRTLGEGRFMPYAANEYLTKIAMRHVPDEAVEERAAQNYEDRE